MILQLKESILSMFTLNHGKRYIKKIKCFMHYNSQKKHLNTKQNYKGAELELSQSESSMDT
jgi:hypothetical protein